MQPPSKIDHLGIAVRSIADACVIYRDALGLDCTGSEEVPDQKVRVVFFRIGEVRIELLEPTTDDSLIARFLDKHGPGLHHVAYQVEDMFSTLAALKAAGVRLIDESPRTGAHGMKIAFIHPKCMDGVLTELCEKPVF